MTTVTISLPESLETSIDQQVSSKGYGNVSEFVRSLLREAQERESELRLQALLVEGLSGGGADMPLSREFWNYLEAEAKELARQHKGRQVS